MSETASILALVGQLQSWLDAGHIPRPKGSIQWEAAKGYINQISQIGAWALAQKHPGIAATGLPLRNLADAMRAAGPSTIFCSGNVAGLGDDLPWQNACTRAERELHSLRVVLGTTAGSELPTIWHHGGQSYSTDGNSPIQVSNEQHNLLKAFLDNDVANDTQSLANSGVSNPAAVVRKLIQSFGEQFIQRPPQKGNGYYIRVRSLPAR